jgi:hypothetical protein
MSETPLSPCECEHECHFDHDSHSDTERCGHSYMGYYTHDTVEITAPFGKFIVCRECADTCFAPLMDELMQEVKERTPTAEEYQDDSDDSDVIMGRR